MSHNHILPFLLIREKKFSRWKKKLYAALKTLLEGTDFVTLRVFIWAILDNLNRAKFCIEITLKFW